MPYRDDSRAMQRAEAPTEGVVADLVQQFADRYAFVRELVQNGLDAGATGLRVEVRRTPDGVVATSVTDDGKGMTRAILLGPLLTVFSSSKEGDGTSIGKYGVGFVSVFALEPDEVTVDTWRPGEAWLVRLAPDHTYTLEPAAPRARSGSVVTLWHRMDRAAFDDHATKLDAAVRRWCRHAERPIELSVSDGDRAEAARAARVDGPLGVRAAVSVTSEEGAERIVVGRPAGSADVGPPTAHGDEAHRFAGFYNRGLTLLETASFQHDDLDGIRFKVSSPHLSHTLSRDDVRRDAAFRQVLERVCALVRGPLRDALAAAMRDAANAVASGDASAVARYAALVDAAHEDPTPVHPTDFVVPLASGGVATLATIAAEELVAATARSRVTDALAASGTRVALASASVALRLSLRAGVDLMEAERDFTLVTADGTERAADAALTRAVREALAAAGQPVASVRFVRTEGAPTAAPAFVLRDVPRDGRVIARSYFTSLASAWDPAYTLALDAASPLVARARGGAPPAATRRRGFLLARLALVSWRGVLGARAAERLLDAWTAEGGGLP